MTDDCDELPDDEWPNDDERHHAGVRGHGRPELFRFRLCRSGASAAVITSIVIWIWVR